MSMFSSQKDKKFEADPLVPQRLPERAVVRKAEPTYPANAGPLKRGFGVASADNAVSFTIRRNESGAGNLVLRDRRPPSTNGACRG